PIYDYSKLNTSGSVAGLISPIGPETAKFLNDDERKILIARLAQDRGEAKMDRLDKRSTKRILIDWKIYCGVLMYFGVVNTGYSGSAGFSSIPTTDPYQ
ncbi:hypothetical protein DHEL01_v212528, partial [Diaporthe helianthi]